MMKATNSIRQQLIFRRDEILYDVTSKLHVIQKQITKEDPETKAIVDDIDDEQNVDMATRTMNLAFQEAVDALYEYSKVPLEKDGALDNTFGDPCHYTIAMRLPSDVSKGTIALVKDQVHEYIVARIIEDWLRLTAPGLAEQWSKTAEDLKTKIGQTSSKRIGGMERPFGIFY